MISSITGFERLMLNRNKETQRLQAIIDEQAEQIDSLLKTVEALVVACEQAADKERAKCAADYLQDCCDAVDAARLEEREACAVECGVQMSLIPAQAWTVNPYEQCMKAIRERGNPDPSFKNFLDDKWSGIV